MSLILNLETATQVCSVALTDGERVISQRLNKEGRNHAALLTTFIDEVLKEAGAEPADLDAVAVSKGPGSYTGLRIGVSTAKGFAYGLGIPLISAGTLKIMASGYLSEFPGVAEKEVALLCPMIDARRMEVYSALYDVSLDLLRNAGADIINTDSYSRFLKDSKIIFFGDGAEKCQDVLTHENAVLDNRYSLSAAHMAKISSDKFRDKIFENVAYFEPFYLKDFIATVPKNKVI